MNVKHKHDDTKGLKFTIHFKYRRRPALSMYYMHGLRLAVTKSVIAIFPAR